MTRKEAIQQYKERKTPRGICAIRCRATNGVWVGASRNLDAAKNSYWFSLKTGAHYDKSLQAAWTAHGEEAFSFEVLEILEDDLHPLALGDLLKSKQTEWVTRLGAEKLS